MTYDAYEWNKRQGSMTFIRYIVIIDDKTYKFTYDNKYFVSKDNSKMYIKYDMDIRSDSSWRPIKMDEEKLFKLLLTHSKIIVE